MRFLRWLAIPAVLAVTPLAGAQAAPQVLAALPSETGVEFVCTNGVCQAELSTYCLQRERPSPNYGQAYVPAAPEHFTLVLEGEDGRTVELVAGDHASFIESRGFMAASALIEEARLNKLGSLNARIRVAEGAALIPVPEAGDPNPLTEEEIAYATKSLRKLGEKIVDSKPAARAAQLLARVANRLPMAGEVTAAGTAPVWQRAIEEELPTLGEIGAEAIGRAEIEFQRCRESGWASSYGGLRQCLDYRHDDLIRDLNVDYWKQQPGV